MKAYFDARLLSTVAVMGLAAAVVPATAMAQNAQERPEAQADASENEGLEAIVVTAQRRTENLQNVPLSVVAVGAEQLRSSGVQTLEAVNRLAPNVVVERVGLFPGAASLSIRGVGYAGIESFTDPDVAVYTNGIYQARNATALAQTIDVAGIEILRGPQGTLFGRNAFAGAISVQTARPEMNVAKGSAGVTIGNFGLADLDFVGNLPIVTDKVAARIAVRQHNLSGLWTNNGITPSGAVDQTLKGKRAGRERSLVVRPSIRFQPTENLDIQFIGEFLRERDQAAPILSAQLNGATIRSIGGVMSNPFGDKRAGIPGDGSDPWVTGFSLSERPMNFDQSSYTADISYTTGIGKMRFLGNYQKTKSDVWADTDGSVANIFSSDRFEDYKGTSAELQYTSDFSDKLNLIAGALYFHDQYKTTQLSFTNTTSINSPAVFNVTSYLSPNSATCFGNQSTAVTTGCTYPAYNVSYINNGGKRTAYAAYMQGEYHLSDPLSVVLGIRYSSERKYDYYGSNSTLAQTGLPLSLDPTLHTLPISDFLPNGRPLIYRADPYKNSNWAPRVGINFKANDDVLLYAFWQRAFKSGGFNANAADLAAFRTPYGPQTVDNFEGGMKAEFFDHKLRVNLSGFYGKYNGLQRSQVTASNTAPSGVTTVTSNTADLKSYGLELEIAAKPTKDLTLFVNGAWNKAYYTRYCADLNGAEASSTPTLAPALAVCGPITTVVSSTGATTYLVPQDYSANRPLRAPRWDITAGFTQNVTIGTGTLSLTGSMNYRSSVDTDLLNRLYSFRPAMTVFDATIKWAPDNGDYSISLWGRNLTNQIQVLGYTPVGNTFAFASPTPPRQYGVAMNVNF
ncbi:TonB-dependent receptor [Novosphingobium sp.]|uniref:TonB-dependent receptor n=1 Tax=Novosphingobium sp. TaxID=1874826 RepID=UPI0035B05FED